MRLRDPCNSFAVYTKKAQTEFSGLRVLQEPKLMASLQCAPLSLKVGELPEEGAKALTYKGECKWAP